VRLMGFVREIDEEVEDDEERKASETDHNKTVKNKEELYERYYIMYDENTGTIHGITKECKQVFGIPLSLTSEHNTGGNNMTIESIFPGILQCPKSALIHPEGAVLTLDTSNLKQTYYIVEDDDETRGEVADKKKGMKDLKFQALSVQVRLVKEYEFSDIKLNVIKFKEVGEQKEFISPMSGELKEKELKKVQKGKRGSSLRKRTKVKVSLLKVVQKVEKIVTFQRLREV